MAYDTIVDGQQLDQDLTAIAEKIKIKSNSHRKVQASKIEPEPADLNFPNDFINGIENIDRDLVLAITTLQGVFSNHSSSDATNISSQNAISTNNALSRLFGSSILPSILKTILNYISDSNVEMTDLDTKTPAEIINLLITNMRNKETIQIGDWKLEKSSKADYSGNYPYKWHYYKDGVLQKTGLTWVDGYGYYFDTSTGDLQIGKKTINSKLYYFQGNGLLFTHGWQKIGTGTAAYFMYAQPNGVIYTNTTATVDGIEYTFDQYGRADKFPPGYNTL